MKLLLSFLLLFSTGFSVAQESIVFNRTRPVEVPTSFTPGVFFIESNPESPGLELFVGGDFINEGINKATAKTYRKNGVEWIIDMDFGTLPTRGRYKKAQLGGGLEEDIVMVNNKGLKIFIGTDSGTYNEAFFLDEQLKEPHVAIFYYESDGDLDMLVNGTTDIAYIIVKNRGDGTFETETFEEPGIVGVLEAGVINDSWHIASITDQGFRQIFRLDESGLQFVRVTGYTALSIKNNITFSDLNGDDIVEIVFSGGNPNFNRGITTVCETPSGGFSCGGADPSVGVGRGDVKFLDVNNDNWKEAFISGQTDNEGEATFQLRYGSDNFEFAGPIQEFTDEQGDIISFTFSSLDVVQDDGVLKILVSGNRCFPEICPEAFLFTQVDCNDSLWYDDTDGAGFGDNYSVSMCSRST